MRFTWGNQFISNRKSTRRIESRHQRCLWSHIWFLGCCPRLIHETAPFGGKQLPGLWSALIGNRYFRRRDYEKATPVIAFALSGFSSSLRFNWPDFIHNGGREERSSCHSRQFTICNCSHRTLLVFLFSFSIGAEYRLVLWQRLFLRQSFIQTGGFQCSLISLEFAG